MSVDGLSDTAQRLCLSAPIPLALPDSPGTFLNLSWEPALTTTSFCLGVQWAPLCLHFSSNSPLLCCHLPPAPGFYSLLRLPTLAQAASHLSLHCTCLGFLSLSPSGTSLYTISNACAAAGGLFLHAFSLARFALHTMGWTPVKPLPYFPYPPTCFKPGTLLLHFLLPLPLPPKAPPTCATATCLPRALHANCLPHHTPTGMGLFLISTPASTAIILYLPTAT